MCAARSRPPRSRRPQPDAASRPALRAGPRCCTVRTTSSGCSSPNCHGRDAPVSSPAAPASATSWSPRLPRRRVSEDPPQRGLPEPAHRLRGQLELPFSPAQVALPLELALDLAQRRRSSTACRPSCALAPPPRRRRRASRRRTPGRACAPAPRGRRAPPAPSSASPMPERLARRASAPGRPQSRSGPQRRAGRRTAGHLWREARRLPSPAPSAAASSSRCSGVSDAHHPLRRRRPPGQRVDQLVEILRVVGEELAVLGHELVELLLGVLAPRRRRRASR